jgi:ribosomal protein L37AE/L43A|tara:strand:- start:5546 stop:5740 length:195 start_codon:yes stop_codon:yes gene_type:complete
MKVKKEYDVIVCDDCSKEADAEIRNFIHKCSRCGGDICELCSVEVVSRGEDGRRSSEIVCKRHY